MNLDRIRIEVARARRPALILALLLLGAVVAGAAMLSRQIFLSPLADYYRVELSVPSAKGVVEGKTEVTISGVGVGLVESADLVGGRPVLTLALDPEQAPLYADATARIAAVTPLQDMYVALDRGSRRSGAVPDGGRLSGSRVSVGVEAGDVLNTFNADTRARLATLLNELGSGVPDGGRRLRAAFGELVPLMHAAHDISRELAVQRRAVERVVHNFADLTETLGRRDRQLTVLVGAGNATLAELAGHDDELAATIAELGPMMVSARRAFAELERAEGDLDPALRHLRPAASRLESGGRALERFMVRARPALRRLRPATSRLRPLAAAARPTAGAARRAFSDLGPRVPTIDRLTAAAVPCMLPLEKVLQQQISAQKFGSSKGSFVRIQLTFGGDSPGGGPDPTLRPIGNCTEGAG